jgi:hypothetical protein
LYSGVAKRIPSAARTARGRLLLDVLVEGRDVLQPEDLERGALGHEPPGGVYRHPVEGGAAQTSGDAEDADVGHGVSAGVG